MSSTEEVLSSLSQEQLTGAITASDGRVANAWLRLQKAMLAGEGDPLDMAREFVRVGEAHRALILERVRRADSPV